MSKNMETVLKEEGVLVSTMSGTSMEPMLRNRTDTVVIKPFEGRLRKYDVALFRYNSQYVLHRIVKVCKDSYIMRGDNCEQKEVGVTDAQVLGVLTEFYRGDKRVDLDGWNYKIYVWIHCKSYYLRWILRRVKRIGMKVLGLIRKEGN